MTTSKQLRPGRHRLSRDEVTAHQRERILAALETVMAAKGYADTSVADIIKSAGVSRQTFYELFSSKPDCFLAGYSRRQGSMIELILQTPADEAPMDRFATALQVYLAAIASDPALSLVYFIGVYAAGPQAIAKRLELQQQFVDVIAEIFGATSTQDRFDCRTLIAAISTLVMNALLEEDPHAVLNLHAPLLRVARQLRTAP